MPEGDTIYRIAEVMRRTLRDDVIVSARGRPGGAQLERLVGARVDRVTTRGKHLLIGFDDGLTVHTHLAMDGTWHRYRPAERWRLRPDEAVAVLETSRAVAVCFNAPTVELVETKALELHPVLARLGPDLLDPDFDVDAATAGLGSSHETIAEALLDQRLVSGIGNVYRSELLFEFGQDPFTPATALTRERAQALLESARRLLVANVGAGDRVTMPDASGATPDVSAAGSRNFDRWVYRRAGRPCRRCGTRIASRSLGRLPRRLYWCPACQASSSVR